MSKITCSKSFGIDTAHRVLGHEGKCKNLHGHRYTITVTAQGEQDGLGRVIDFSVIKDLLGKWLDEFWDHGVIVYENDKELALSALSINGKEKTYILNMNPTAENLAHHLLNAVCPSLFRNTAVNIIKVRVDETPSCYAEAERTHE